MGIILNDKKSQKKVTGNFTINRIIILLVVVLSSALLSNAVHKGVMRILFMVFCVLVCFIATGKSPTNPKKNFLIGLLDFFKYKIHRKIYYSIFSNEYIASEAAKEDEHRARKNKIKKISIKKKPVEKSADSKNDQ